MSSRVSADRFAAALQKLLIEYQEDVTKDVTQLAKKFTQKGTKEVKNASGQFGGSGTYASGWTNKFETGRVSAQGVIYNSKEPGIPHLLENGHALRQGGRAPAYVHISPVEEKLTKEFQRAVEDSI